MKRRFARISIGFGLAIAIVACSPAAEPVVSGVPIMGGENVVAVTADNQILWNGEAVSSAHLADLLAETAARTLEPRLTFAPEADASDDVSRIVLGIIKASDVTNLGFVGNEKSSAP